MNELELIQFSFREMARRLFVAEGLFFATRIVRTHAWLLGYDILVNGSDCLSIIFVGIIVSIWIQILFPENNKGREIVGIVGALGVTIVVTVMSLIIHCSLDQTRCVTDLITKGKSQESYYFCIDGRNPHQIVKIECEEAEYVELKVDENVLYTIEYRVTRIFPEKGFLRFMDVNNPIDNN